MKVLGERRSEGSELRAVVEKLAKANREDEVAEEGMVNGGEQERAGAVIGEGEKQASEAAEADGKPVSKDDVDKGKGQAASRNHAASAAKKRLVSLKEEGAIDKFLGAYGEQGIQQHDGGPKQGLAPDKRKQKLGGKHTHRQAQQNQQDGIAQEHRGEFRPDSPPGKQLRRAHSRVAPQNEEASHCGQEQVRNWKIGNDMQKDQEGRNHKKGNKLNQKSS